MIVPITAGSSAAAVNLRGTPATTTAPPASAGMIRIAVGLRPGSSATRVSSGVSGGWST